MLCHDDVGYNAGYAPKVFLLAVAARLAVESLECGEFNVAVWMRLDTISTK